MGPHDAQMIAKGLSGAGNIIFLDNGYKSRFGDNYNQPAVAYEINPKNKQIVWSYQNPKFYNESGGGIQRLPNGNTLISYDSYGQIIELNKSNDKVWEIEVDGRTKWPKKYDYSYCK